MQATYSDSSFDSGLFNNSLSNDVYSFDNIQMFQYECVTIIKTQHIEF